MANDSNNDDLLFLNEKAGGGACTERSRGKGRSRGDKGQDGNKLVLEIQGKGQSEKAVHHNQLCVSNISSMTKD